jgi:hypothetical protein
MSVLSVCMVTRGRVQVHTFEVLRVGASDARARVPAVEAAEHAGARVDDHELSIESVIIAEPRVARARDLVVGIQRIYDGGWDPTDI